MMIGKGRKITRAADSQIACTQYAFALFCNN